MITIQIIVIFTVSLASITGKNVFKIRVKEIFAFVQFVYLFVMNDVSKIKSIVNLEFYERVFD